jgi:hypothetical protein
VHRTRSTPTSGGSRLSRLAELTQLAPFTVGEVVGQREGEVAEDLDVLVLQRREAFEVLVGDLVAGGAKLGDGVVEVLGVQSTSALSAKPNAPSWSSWPSR